MDERLESGSGDGGPVLKGIDNALRNWQVSSLPIHSALRGPDMVLLRIQTKTGTETCSGNGNQRDLCESIPACPYIDQGKFIFARSPESCLYIAENGVEAEPLKT